jgi:hypothetical protein
MRMFRDIFYINAFPEENLAIWYGMIFEEFIKYAPVEVNHLLLLEAMHYSNDFSRSTRLNVVGKDSMRNLLCKDIYNFGDFCWVDYDQRENIERLEPVEVAELLYLGHMFRPVKSPFFDKLQNRYAYLAHDDGSLCRMYCRYYSDFQEIISNKIVGTVSTNKRRRIYPFPEDLKVKLITLAEDGLVIDFSKTLRWEKTIEIPIHCIGKFLDMDDMYHNLERHIYHSKYSAWLVHKDKNWKIIDVVKDKEAELT